MSYTAIYGISAEVEQVPNEAIDAKGNILLKATYTGIGLYETLEEALLVAVSNVIDRFQGQVTTDISVDAKGEFKEMKFGSTEYAPLGQIEIPLMFVSQIELDVSQDVEKFFEIAAPVVG